MKKYFVIANIDDGFGRRYRDIVYTANSSDEANAFIEFRKKYGHDTSELSVKESD